MHTDSQYYVYRDGSILGPYTAVEIHERVKGQSLSEDDFLWREGLPDWTPYRDYFGGVDSTNEKQTFAKKRVSPEPAPKRKNHGVLIAATGLSIILSLFLVFSRFTSGDKGSLYISDTSTPSYTVMRNATLRAWNELQAADNKLRLIQNLSPSQRAAQAAYLYSQIDLTDVDPILIDHLRDSVNVYKNASNILAVLEEEQISLQQSTGAAAGLGALLGAAGSDGSNIQADAAGGALLVGLLGAAINEARWQMKLEEIKPNLEKIDTEFKRINEQEATVANNLSKKYNTMFIDAF